jgi:hypothetical protein
VTAGREIENYLSAEKLETIVKIVHPSTSRIAGKGTWANLLQYRKPRARKNKTANKVKVAFRFIAEYEPDFSLLDLKPRIQELCRFIRCWNDGLAG